MKIRADFVTNSSSASYTVLPRYNKTVKNIAEMMLNYCIENKFGNLYKVQLKRLKYVPDDIKAIMFWTTNYNTYIFEKNGEICINTCNNIEFDNIGIFTYNDDEVRIIYDKNLSFYNLKINDYMSNIFSPATLYKSNVECYCFEFGVKNNGDIVCIRCGKTPVDFERILCVELAFQK